MSDANPNPKMRWVWIYRDLELDGKRERTDEVHLFPPEIISKKNFANPVFQVPDDIQSRCGKRFVSAPAIGTFLGRWMVFNTGVDGNVQRLVAISGNRVVFCDECREFEEP